MTVAPAYTTQPAQRQGHPVALAFLHTLYGDQTGYAELSTIEGDPRPGCGGIYRKQGYYAWPHQAEELAADIAFWGTLHGNVYVSSSLYAQKNRKHPLSSRIVFLDDAPEAPELPYSLCVQTSPGSRHAYYLLDQAISPEDRRDLQRRAAAAAGADKSGSDLQQVVRVPGCTFNTKAHQRHPVTVISAELCTYTAEQLRQRWPAVPDRRKAAADSGYKADSELWQHAKPHLANIDALRGCGRVTCMQASTQTPRILALELLTFIVKGRPDASRSMNCCALSHGLLVRGFPDEEIAALCYDFYRRTGEVKDKGSAWCQQDIEARILPDAHVQYPNAKQSPTRYLQLREAEEIIEVAPARISRARHDRPQVLGGVDDTLRRLGALQDAEGKVCKDRAELARALGVSIATLDRHLKPLKAAGLVQWVRYNQRQDAYLALSDAALMMIARPLAPEAAEPARDVLSGQQDTALESVPCSAAPMEDTQPPPCPLSSVGFLDWRAPFPHQDAENGTLPARGVFPHQNALRQKNLHLKAPCPPLSGAAPGVVASAADVLPELANAPQARGCVPPSGPAARPAAVLPPPSVASAHVEPLPAFATSDLPALVCAAIDAIPHCYPQASGEVGKVTLARVVAYVLDVLCSLSCPWPWPEAEIEAAYQTEQARRQKEAAQQRAAARTPEQRCADLERQLAALEAKAHGWRLPTLKAKARDYGSRSNDLRRQGKIGMAYVWQRKAGVVEAEIVRRTDIAAEDALIDFDIARAHAQQVADMTEIAPVSPIGEPAPLPPEAVQLGLGDVVPPAPHALPSDPYGPTFVADMIARLKVQRDAPPTPAADPPIPRGDFRVNAAGARISEQRAHAALTQCGYTLRPATWDEQQAGIDFVGTDPAGAPVTIEVKSERTSARTGNAFIEVLADDAHGRLGWAHTSTADLLLHLEPISGAWRLVPMAGVRRSLPQWEQRYGRRTGPVNTFGAVPFRSEGIPVPLAELERHAIATGVCPPAPDVAPSA